MIGGVLIWHFGVRGCAIKRLPGRRRAGKAGFRAAVSEALKDGAACNGTTNGGLLREATGVLAKLVPLVHLGEVDIFLPSAAFT